MGLRKTMVCGLLAVMMVAGGCGGGSGSGKTASETEKVTVLPDLEFTEGVNQGGITLIKSSDSADQMAAAIEQNETDNADIDDFLSANESACDPRPGIPSSDEPTVEKLPDGNIRHTISLKNGRQSKVITLGDMMAVHTIAEGIRIFPTRNNQLGIYRRLYSSLSADLIGHLGLVNPDDVEAHPVEYGVTQITAFNASIIEHKAQVIGTLAIDPGNLTDYFNCRTDIGTGAESDRVGCEADCTFLPGGIVASYSWNHKGSVSCVKDQANRGTCCAFAVVSATEYWVSRKKNLRVNLSEQALYNQMTYNWVRSDLVDGYYISNALDYAISNNYLIPFENQWNYNPSRNRTEDKNIDGDIVRLRHSCDNYNETCSNSAHQSEYVCNASGTQCGFSVPNINPDSRGYRLKSGHVIWDHNDPETSFVRALIYLAMGDPVLIQVPVLDQFDDAFETGYVTYVSGDHDDPAIGKKSTNRGNHIMHVVSYIDNEDLPQGAPNGSGGGYFIVKNSWSTCWGDGGYIYLPYAFIKEYTQYGSVLTAIKE